MLGKRVDKNYPQGLDGKIEDGSVARFRARYRVAKAISEIEFTGQWSRDTRLGYVALIRCFLAYSAYEKFSKFFGFTSDKKRIELEEKYVSVELEEKLNRSGRELRSFFKFLKTEAEGDGPKAAATAAMDGAKYSPIHLAEAVRNSFCHGSLTPNVWSSKPDSVAEYCGLLTGLMLRMMDGEAAVRYRARREKLAKKAGASTGNESLDSAMDELVLELIENWPGEAGGAA